MTTPGGRASDGKWFVRQQQLPVGLAATAPAALVSRSPGVGGRTDGRRRASARNRERSFAFIVDDATVVCVRSYNYYSPLCRSLVHRRPVEVVFNVDDDESRAAIERTALYKPEISRHLHTTGFHIRPIWRDGGKWKNPPDPTRVRKERSPTDRPTDRQPERRILTSTRLPSCSAGRSSELETARILPKIRFVRVANAWRFTSLLV